jgi:uncharacterized membrane protein
LLPVDAISLFAMAGIGFVAGLRSLLAPAAVVWAVRLGWVNLHGSPLGFLESTVALATLSLLALGELIADLFPNIPRRTAPLPLLARLLSGGFCGACLCLSVQKSWPLGAALGGLGAVIGAFAGYEIRKRLVSKFNIADRFVALGEDFIALSLAVLSVSR